MLHIPKKKGVNQLAQDSLKFSKDQTKKKKKIKENFQGQEKTFHNQHHVEMNDYPIHKVKKYPSCSS